MICARDGCGLEFSPYRPRQMFCSRGCYDVAYRAAHRKERNAYTRAYAAAHRGERRERMRAYRRRNRRRLRAYHRAWGARRRVKSNASLEVRIGRAGR